MKLDPCFVKSWSTSGDAIDTSDSFIFFDEKPTESLKAGDSAMFDIGDLAVDPNNPHVELPAAGTPGPDDNVGLPAVQMAGLPAVQMGDSYAGSHALYQDVFIPG